MDANYKPVLDTYRKMPLVIGALQKRGYSDAQLAKFAGGNFLRVMAEVQTLGFSPLTIQQFPPISTNPFL